MKCPRFKCQGLIYKAFIPALRIKVFLCDDCEALWLKNQKIVVETFEDLSTFLESRHLDYMKTKIENLGYDWDKEK